MYTLARQYEADNKETLLEYLDEKPRSINADNVNDVLESLRKRKSLM